MPDYQLSKVYRIVSGQTDKIYVGSTTVPLLCQRFGQHKANYKIFQKGLYHFVTSFEIIKYNDAKIILIEAFPCNSKDQLLAREQYHLNLNKEIIVNQYKAKHLGEVEYNKAYYEINKEKIISKVKTYVEANKEKVKTYKRTHFKTYAEINKEKILARKSSKLTCFCGVEHSYSNKNVHIKSKKHLAFVESHPDELKSDVLANGGNDQRNTE